MGEFELNRLTSYEYIWFSVQEQSVLSVQLVLEAHGQKRGRSQLFSRGLIWTYIGMLPNK